MLVRMITIHLRFNGGSTEEEHDIAHIASSIFSPPCAGFFLSCDWRGESLKLYVFGGVNLLSSGFKRRKSKKLAQENIASSSSLWQLHVMLFQHGAQLVIGYTKQLRGAALIKVCLLQALFK